jgi:hypothetical protein
VLKAKFPTIAVHSEELLGEKHGQAENDGQATDQLENGGKCVNVENGNGEFKPK